MSDQYRDFLLNASTKELIQQLNLEVKEPLVSAQNTINLLLMALNPSPNVAKKLETGEINPPAMLNQLTEDITRVLDILDFYRATLDE